MRLGAFKKNERSDNRKPGVKKFKWELSTNNF